MRRVGFVLLVVLVTFDWVGPARADEKPFETFHCLQLGTIDDYPVDRLLLGSPLDATVDTPMAMCVARHGSEVVVMDAGYSNRELDGAWNLVDYVEYGELFAEIGVSLDQVTYVTVSHLHFDHAGGTPLFPRARIILQARELEYAAGRMAANTHARMGVQADDVLQMVKLNWQGRMLLVDGDREGVVPGLDVYLTPGHTVGTMTVCAETVGGRVCYASDAVYTYRNLEEDIPLGFAADSLEAVESYDKIRRILRGGILIPGHEAAMFETPEKFGFKRVSEHAVAIVE